MATVPLNVIACWPSTAASIPANWSRETSLDAVFVQGAATGADADLTTVRGAATHTHTSAAHTPIQNSHVHTFSAGNGNFTVKVASGTGSSAATHTHASTNSASTTGTNQSSTVNFGANSSNDVPYIAVIFIKSDGTPTGVPVNAYGFFSSDTLPTGWTRVQGNTYLKGAAAAGDGGGTGGALTHTHTSDSHTHTQNSHTHAATNSAASSSSTPQDIGIEVAPAAHVHSVSLNAGTPTNQALTNTTSADNHEPVFKKLNTINNGNGTADLPDQLILLWGGTNAGIPANWARFTSMDGNFHKGANADGESNVTTGGATTHTHTATCQPTQNTHNHTSTAGGGGTSLSGDDTVSGATVRESQDNHTHTWTIGNTVATNQNLTYNVTANSSESAYPLYRRVIFIQWTAPAVITILGASQAQLLMGK